MHPNLELLSNEPILRALAVGSTVSPRAFMRRLWQSSTPLCTAMQNFAAPRVHDFCWPCLVSRYVKPNISIQSIHIPKCRRDPQSYRPTTPRHVSRTTRGSFRFSGPLGLVSKGLRHLAQKVLVTSMVTGATCDGSGDGS